MTNNHIYFIPFFFASVDVYAKLHRAGGETSFELLDCHDTLASLFAVSGSANRYLDRYEPSLTTTYNTSKTSGEAGVELEPPPWPVSQGSKRSRADRRHPWMRRYPVGAKHV